MSNRKFENSPDDIVIVSGARTAVAKFGGSLKTMSAIDMAPSSSPRPSSAPASTPPSSTSASSARWVAGAPTASSPAPSA